jgi:glucose-6-phosphate isomerase
MHKIIDKIKESTGLGSLQCSSINACDITFNLECQTLPQSALDHFQEWLSITDFNNKRAGLFNGSEINKSEARCALHTALRANDLQELIVSGEDVAQQIKDSLNKMSVLIDSITSGAYKPVGKQIADVVHIGVGGSALGPELCYSALREYRRNNIRVHFITVIDAEVLNDLLDKLNPETTLFFLASKSFSTEEVFCQAKIAQDWLKQNNVNPVEHFLAATAEIAKAQEFGVKQENILPFWDWVGGRFSVWSSVSFCVALAIGMDNFRSFLAGASAMDQHFKAAPPQDNLPIMLACLSAWHTDINGLQAHGIIPYSSKLELLPAFLQQLHMESLGKSKTIDGKINTHLASPIIFGDIGTRSQHSLSQYFMQAPTMVPLDILYLEQDKDSANKRLVAHAKAQSQVLWNGFEDAVEPYKDIAAKHAHTLIQIKELTPCALGSLLAMYEHKVFTLGVMYNINMFDQWGVERGKLIAKQILGHKTTDE